MGTSSLGWRSDRLPGPGQPAPSHLLPTQYTALLPLPSARTPEVKLMGAVLEDAIRCFCGCAGSPGIRSQKLFQETAEWFASHDISWPMAFENICDALALDPDWIRGLLTRWGSGRESPAGWPVAVAGVRLHIAGSRHRVGAGVPRPRHPSRPTAPSAERVGAGW